MTRLLMVLLAPTMWAFVFFVFNYESIIGHVRWRMGMQASRHENTEYDPVYKTDSEKAKVDDDYDEYEASVADRWGSYSEASMNWKGGPEPLSEQILIDFYNTVFQEGVNDYVYPYDDYENSNETITLYNTKYDEFLNGAYGLAYYSGLQAAVNKFNFERGADPTLREDDFWDLSYIERFVGLPLYDEARRTALGIKFSCYNPEMVKWLFDNMVPSPDLVIYDHQFQEIYNVIGARYFRLMIESYLYLKKKGLAEEVNLYRSAIGRPDFEGKEYLSNRYEGVLPEYDVDNVSIQFGYLSAKVAIGYWLRRLIDGSADEFFRGHLKVLKLYDEVWYNEILDQHGYSGLELTLAPGMEARQISHVSLIFPIGSINQTKKETHFNDSTFSFSEGQQLDELVLHHSLVWLANKVDIYKTDRLRFRLPDFESAEFYLGGSYKAGDFIVFTFAVKGVSSVWFAAIFNGDKILSQPVLLSAVYNDKNVEVTYSSHIKLINTNKIEIQGTQIVKFKETDNEGVDSGKQDSTQFAEVIDGVDNFVRFSECL